MVPLSVGMELSPLSHLEMLPNNFYSTQNLKEISKSTNLPQQSPEKCKTRQGNGSSEIGAGQ